MVQARRFPPQRGDPIVPEPPPTDWEPWMAHVAPPSPPPSPPAQSQKKLEAEWAAPTTAEDAVLSPGSVQTEMVQSPLLTGPSVGVTLEDEVNKSLENITSYHDLVAALDVTSIADSSIEKRKEFQNDVKLLRQRMRTSRRGLLNPRAKSVQYWDLVTTCALAFTATITPFEVCLGLPTEWNALLYVNLVVNMIFLIDIGVQFLLPYVDAKSGEIVRNHKRIADHYLRSWFIIDLGTVLPFDLMTVLAPALFASDCGTGGTQSLIKGVKLLRVLRLVKLLRVLRASRIIQRWESSISVTTSTRSVVTAIVAFVALLHWLACLWSLLPQMDEGLRSTPGLADRLTIRVAKDADCSACLCDSDPLTTEACRNPCLTDCEIEEMMLLTGFNRELIYNRQSWICRAVSEGLLQPNYQEHPFSTWVAALVVAMLQLLGGVAEIQPNNDAESVVFIFSVLVGTVVFAGVQGVIIRVITTGNPDEMFFRQNLDALNFMMRDQRIPHDVRLRVRDYFRRAKGLVKRKSYVELIDLTLSTKMRAEMQYLISCSVFKAVWWLRQCEAEFLQQLACVTEREAFAADEKIQNVDETGESRMCILDQGIASRGGAILTTGASWGDLLITSQLLRDMRLAKALGYCEVVMLTKSRLEEASTNFPMSAQLIREAGLKLATQRAMIVISMYTRLRLHRTRDAVRRLAKRANGNISPTGVGSPGGMSDEVNALMEPSQVLLAMRKANLMPNVGWREVEYVSSTESKAGKRPVALQETEDSADDSSVDDEQLKYASPGIGAMKGGGVGPASTSPPPPRSRSTGQSILHKSRQAAENGGAGNKFTMGPRTPITKASGGGGGGGGSLVDLSRKQAQCMTTVSRLADDVKTVQAQLMRIEELLAKGGAGAHHDGPMSA